MDFKTILEHHLLDHTIARWPGVFGIEFALTKHLLMMWIVGTVLLLGLGFVARSGRRLPLLRSLVEVLVIFVRDEVLGPALGHAGRKYLPYFLSLFFFILLCNLSGLVPWGSTATGNISVTATLAGCTFFLIHIAGIREQGLGHYLKSIVPSGLPWWLIPIMIPIELIGFCTKAFALSIRLFANMIAGHIVILAFLCLIFTFGAANPWTGFLAAPFSVMLALFVYALEIFVAFLQAYIFTFLTALFVGAAVHPEH
ncbi:MAG: F0F1 ATP synthase subunit A [Elusimicrobia bacterium]|nr:F0F1 ATP synthase subunit A [Elusimicrobiota bacterium]